jgi:hypothetical protein
MFMFPQPPSADMETIEGVSVVTLHDDPAEMEVFLRAIFDSEWALYVLGTKRGPLTCVFLFFSFFTSPVESDHKIEDILGILRLAHKYDVPYLRRRTLKYLWAIYPTLLSEYDCREDTDSDETVGRGLATIVTAMEVARSVPCGSSPPLITTYASGNFRRSSMAPDGLPLEKRNGGHVSSVTRRSSELSRNSPNFFLPRRTKTMTVKIRRGVTGSVLKSALLSPLKCVVIRRSFPFSGPRHCGRC